jgi:soluble lytic murein transglycosylase-like protein
MTMPAKRAKQPVKRKARRRPGRTAKSRGGKESPGRVLLRAGAVSALVAGFVFFVPPVRSTFAHARDVLADAMAASRKAELRRLATARYALEYGVSLQLASDIERAAVAEGIDPELAFRLVRVESEFKERAMSPVGALGLTQLMPATAEELQPGITKEEMFDRNTNLRLGFRYLRWLLKVYDGDVTEALHAYNRGPGTVARLRQRGQDPANGYADRVLRGPGTPTYRGNGLLP